MPEPDAPPPAAETAEFPLSTPSRYRAGFVFRVALLASAVFMSVALVFSALVWWRLGDFVAARTDQEIEQEVIEQRANFAAGGVERVAEQARVLEDSGERARLLIQLRERDGTLIAGPRLNFGSPPPPGWSEAAARPPWAHGRIPFRILTARLPDGRRLVVARDVREDRNIVAALSRDVMLGGLLAAALSLAAGWFVSRRIARRLAAVNTAVVQVMEGDLSGRLPLSGSGDELDRLLRLINAMLERLESLMVGLRRVSDDIAHDLRTPLTRLRQRTEAALERPRDQTLDRKEFEGIALEADTILETFAALLRIGQVEAGARMAAFQRFDLSAALAETCDTYEPILADAGGLLETRIAPGLELFGDRLLVEQCVVNLFENALRHGGPSPHVELSAHRRDGVVEVVVRDHGPGIPREELSRVFERFYRLDRSRSSHGSGLGLSLAAAVMRLHGGRIMLDNAQPGLQAVLTFPAARQ
ncbi:HAMP domain-containing protein [Roseomonas sp. JC162]|uniref:histidine kinase n=1 Tax=Neoroseomonas marina TaxID=1232220 RepID=A0A848E7V0_9PROT|nr:ATP-binding protein [Neoroseomonas marina]NMJ40242.1 HAMP domain-containing protein [Neoroseomonas marina]